MMRRALLTALFVLGLSCDPVEIRIDESNGVPGLSGQYSVNIGNFTCGEPLSAEGYTVTTAVEGDGCRFSFTSTLEVLSASHYEHIGELRKAANFVQRIEIEVTQLTFSDGAGNGLDLNTQVSDASLSMNGQPVANKQQLSSLPVTVELTGEALRPLKTQIDKAQPASVQVTATLLVPNDPPPPATLAVSYQAQPAVIVGPGEITIF